MDATAARLEHLRENPGVGITVLGDSWYTHLSLVGSVAEIRADPEMIDSTRSRTAIRTGRTSAPTGDSLVTVHRRRRALALLAPDD